MAVHNEVTMGVTIRLFHYVILAVYVYRLCSKFICTGNSLLYILPTDHLLYNVSCSQNDCHTFNELIESNLSKLETTLALLPGVHVINTTRKVLPLVLVLIMWGLIYLLTPYILWAVPMPIIFRY